MQNDPPARWLEAHPPASRSAAGCSSGARGRAAVALASWTPFSELPCQTVLISEGCSLSRDLGLDCASVEDGTYGAELLRIFNFPLLHKVMSCLTGPCFLIRLCSSHSKAFFSNALMFSNLQGKGRQGPSLPPLAEKHEAGHADKADLNDTNG